MKRLTHRCLVTVATLAVAGALPVLAGCGPSSTGTNNPYEPADGVSASVGAISARNLVLVGSVAGQPGLVSGVLLNESGEAITVSLSSGQAQAVSVDVPAGSSVLLGAPSSAPALAPVAGRPGAAVVQFPSLPQPAGTFLPLLLSTPDGGTTTVQVPVLPAKFEYASITPNPAPSLTPQ